MSAVGKKMEADGSAMRRKGSGKELMVRSRTEEEEEKKKEFSFQVEKAKKKTRSRRKFRRENFFFRKIATGDYAVHLLFLLSRETKGPFFARSILAIY